MIETRLISTIDFSLKATMKPIVLTQFTSEILKREEKNLYQPLEQ